MKALVYKGIGQLQLEERDMPEGDILIRVIASGVCGTDLKTYLKGHHMFEPNSVLGHECYGQITRAADHVTAFKEGDCVVVAPYYECGECEVCRKGVGQLCPNKTFLNSGCFQEYVAVSASYADKGLYRIDGPDDVYTLVEPLACVINGIEKLDLTQGRKVLVVGSGPMGTLFAIALTRMGVPVDIVEVSEYRKQLLQHLQFHVIAPDDVRPGKYDQIVLTVNQPPLVQHYVSLAAIGGNVLLFSGFARTDRAEIDPYDVHYREVRMTGSFGYNLAHFTQALEMIRGNKDSFRPMITHRYTLGEGEAAFARLKEGQAMKLILAAE